MANQRQIDLPIGITLRKNDKSTSICISFNYQGKRCKEYLKLDPTRENIKYAANIRSSILLAIEKNEFNYTDFFPNSKRARYFGHASVNIKVADLLEQYIARAKKTLEPSTVYAYVQATNAQLLPAFGDLLIGNLTPQIIRDYIERSNKTMKYMRNVLIPLRHVIEQCITDGIIEKNPLDKIFLNKLMPKKSKERTRNINPYTPQETKLFLAACADYHPQMANYFKFAISTGLRPSEMFALEWSNIDFNRNVIKVTNAFVYGKKKATKTASGVREIPIFKEAREALEAQKPYTALMKKKVFHNPNGNKPWGNDKQLWNIWDEIYHSRCDKKLIEWHTPYQTRHTFASTLLTAGENLWAVATLLGHKNVQMVLNTYGKFIKDSDTSSGYKLVNNW